MTIDDFHKEFEQTMAHALQLEHTEAKLRQMENDDAYLGRVRQVGESQGWSEQRIIAAQALVMAARSKLLEGMMNVADRLKSPSIIVAPRPAEGGERDA